MADLKEIAEKLAFNLELEVAPQDAEELEEEAKRREEEKFFDEASKKAPKVVLRRTKKLIVDKMRTPLWKLEDMFISEQEGKNNSIHTIEYYKKCFQSLYKFLAFELPKTVDDYKKVLDKYNSEADFGKILPIVTLEMDDFEKLYKDYLIDVREVNEQTINNLFRGYRAIAYYAMDNGWLTPRRISIKDIEPPIKQTYTAEEIERLLRKPNIDNFSEYRTWVMVCYLLATGNRVSSLISLKVGDIDLEEGFVNVNTQKNRTPIRIPLIKSIIPKLEEYIYEYRTNDKGVPLYNEPLFCNPYGEELTRDAVTKAIARYNQSRGVEKTSIHLFRHTFAKNWILDGGDIMTLQKMLGQKTLKMVQRYANLYSTDIKPKAEEHGLLNKVQEKTGRKKIKRRGGNR